jgi:hypothetical protein
MHPDRQSEAMASGAMGQEWTLVRQEKDDAPFRLRASLM